MRSSGLLSAALVLGLAACGSTALSPDGGGGGSDGGASGTSGAAGGGTTGHAGSTGSGVSCTCDTYDSPVCGSDGKTYGNSCEAQCAGVGVAYGGECIAVSSSITFQLRVPTGTSFCDQVMGCGVAPAHITILDANGKELAMGRPPCTVLCGATCQPAVCPLGSCTAPHGAVFTGLELPWDGTYFTTSTRGQGLNCYAPHVAAAGQYVARMCATPGTLSSSDAGSISTCVASSDEICVDVPFDYPGPTLVIGRVGAAR